MEASSKKSSDATFVPNSSLGLWWAQVPGQSREASATGCGRRGMKPSNYHQSWRYDHGGMTMVVLTVLLLGGISSRSSANLVN